MLLNIILPILVFFILALVISIVEILFCDKYIFEKITEEKTARFRDKYRFVLFGNLREIDTNSRKRIIIPSVITGLAMANTYWFLGGEVWPGVFLGIIWYILAAITVAAVLGLMIYFTVWWFQAGVKLRELIAFSALLAVMILPVRSTFSLISVGLLNMNAVSAVNGEFTRSLIKNVIPALIMIIAAGVAFTRYFYRNWLNGGRVAMRVGAIVTVILIALASTITVARGANWSALPKDNGATSDTTPTNATTATEPETDPVDLDEAVKKLTVTKVTPEELEEKETLGKFKGISWKLLDSSLSSKDKSRTKSTGFSDALTFGFKKKNDKGRYKEIYVETLRNPVYMVTVINAIKGKKLGGKTFAEINPWMKEVSQANKKYGVTHWLEYRDDDKEVIYVTKEYRLYAATLCNLYDRLLSQGIQTKRTSENWCLNNVLTNNDRAGVKASYQYKKEAWILMYVAKNGQSLFTIGFNIHDKRPEFFSEKDKPKVVNSPSSSKTPKGSTSSNPKTSSTTSTPNDKPKNWQKDPADDPVNQGNAQKGGGDNNPSDGSGDYQPKDPRTETQNPGSVKPQTPTVAPGHSSDDIVDDQNQMGYETDPVTDRGPVDQKPPTNSNGDGEFSPAD